MTLRYLKKGVPVNLVSGKGTVSLTPDTGQYWIPRLIRVGVNLPTSLAFPTNQPSLSCVLYHGGVGDTGVDAYVDGTGNGLGDVTAVMNGTLIQTGEYLTAQWSPLDLVNTTFPTTSGYLEIIGMTADTIIEATAALATASPGAGFVEPIPSAMRMPPAPNDGSVFQFNNPGQNNSVILLNPGTGTYLYLYSIEVYPFQTGTGAEGRFEPVGSTNATAIAFINPFSYIGPMYVQFYGMRMQPNGLQFTQSGNAAANIVTYGTAVTHRFMPF